MSNEAIITLTHSLTLSLSLTFKLEKMMSRSSVVLSSGLEEEREYSVNMVVVYRRDRLWASLWLGSTDTHTSRF